MTGRIDSKYGCFSSELGQRPCVSQPRLHGSLKRLREWMHAQIGHFGNNDVVSFSYRTVSSVERQSRWQERLHSVSKWVIAELHPHASGVPYLRENKNLSMPENLAMTSAYACTPVRTLREVVRRGWGGAGDGVTGNFYARNEIGQPEFFLARILAKNSFDSETIFLQRFSFSLEKTQ